MLSRISSADAPLGYGDWGWHNSPSEGYPSYAGILLPTPQVVTHLAFLAHYNPFADFKLQGSNDSSTGFDGQWVDLLSETVPHAQAEEVPYDWSVPNATAFSAYRIVIESDYAGGWAMYRWDLLSPIPEPSTAWLMAAGLLALRPLRWRRPDHPASSKLHEAMGHQR